MLWEDCAGVLSGEGFGISTFPRHKAIFCNILLTMNLSFQDCLNAFYLPKQNLIYFSSPGINDMLEEFAET